MNMTNQSIHHDPPKADRLLGPFQKEADAFFRSQIDPETYSRVMSSEDGRAHPYVAARIMLNNEQWEQYLWVSHHGSLTGYKKDGGIDA